MITNYESSNYMLVDLSLFFSSGILLSVLEFKPVIVKTLPKDILIVSLVVK